MALLFQHFLLPSTGVFSVILILDLNDSDCVMLSFGLSLNDLSSSQHSVNKNIRFRTSLLRSDLCDYSGAYIVVKGTITVEGNDDAKKKK